MHRLIRFRFCLSGDPDIYTFSTVEELLEIDYVHILSTNPDHKGFFVTISYNGNVSLTWHKGHNTTILIGRLELDGPIDLPIIHQNNRPHIISSCNNLNWSEEGF